jgi:hypothetical protein
VALACDDELVKRGTGVAHVGIGNRQADVMRDRPCQAQRFNRARGGGGDARRSEQHRRNRSSHGERQWSPARHDPRSRLREPVAYHCAQYGFLTRRRPIGENSGSGTQ